MLVVLPNCRETRNIIWSISVLADVTQVSLKMFHYLGGYLACWHSNRRYGSTFSFSGRRYVISCRGQTVAHHNWLFLKVRKQLLWGRVFPPPYIITDSKILSVCGAFTSWFYFYVHFASVYFILKVDRTYLISFLSRILCFVHIRQQGFDPPVCPPTHPIYISKCGSTLQYFHNHRDTNPCT